MSRRTSLSLLALASLLGSPLLAQSDAYTQEGFEDLPPTATRPNEPPPLQLRFELQHEVTFPGPLSGAAPRWAAGKVRVPLAEGEMEVDLLAEVPTTRRVESPPETSSDEEVWVEDAEGRFRYRTRDEGLLLAQHRCSYCRNGWRRAWKLRIAGATLAPPLVLPESVCLGTLGNQIYCVKPRRGFRRWTIDIEGRLSAALVGVPSPVDAAEGDPVEPVILALPDAGTPLLAFDGASGIELARVAPDESARMVGGVLSTDDGAIIVARQGYKAEDARLIVYRLRPIQAATDPLSEAQAAAVPR